LNTEFLHRELSLGYLKDTKFFLESKASFIHISSIASFKPFLIAWLWEQYGTIFSCCTIKHFFFFKYILYSTVLSKYLKKKIRGHRAHLRKKGHYFTIELSLREISYVLYAHVLMWVALMTRKSCTVGMCNAILRSNLK